MKGRCTALVVGFATLLMMQSAFAISIGFNPTSTSVTLGDSFGVDVVVSGLREGSTDEVVSAFDLDILYDATLLTASGFEFGTALGALGLDALASSVGSAGRLDLASISFLDVPSLLSLQADSVVLGRLLFDAIGIGHSFLTFDALRAPGVLLVGANPFADLAISSIGVGSIEIVGATSVPEPASLVLLFLVGGLALRIFPAHRASAARA